MTHKDWLDNEYKLWIEALQGSTVHNFKEHPMVRRMLSLDIEVGVKSEFEFSYFKLTSHEDYLITKIDNIGFAGFNFPSGYCKRIIYWAQQVLKRNPKSIVEIGGGVGELYAILRALGYGGDYDIYDIPEVKQFQRKYLDEVKRQTGLSTDFNFKEFDFVCSFYAFGEFTDEIKQWYIDTVINHCPHGLIVWNPHSGANLEFPKTVHELTIQDTIEDGIKLVTW